jgi:hypothetical protein
VLGEGGIIVESNGLAQRLKSAAVLHFGSELRVALQTTIHRALRLQPHIWPALPSPNGPSSPGARALYAQLDAALTGT